MNKYSFLLITLLCLVLSGCVDSNYDLSNINTDARINVNDLVIPINMDEVTLKSVLDLKETSKIKVREINGESVYALVEDGTFKSANIQVPSFKTGSPAINPIQDKLNLSVTEAGAKMREGAADGNEKVAYYKLSDVSTNFGVLAKEIDKAVLSFTYAQVEASFGISLDVSQLTKYLKKVHFENLELQLIKGLNISEIQFQGVNVDPECYNPTTGILNLAELDLTFDEGKFAFRMVFNGLDAQLAGIIFDKETRSLTFKNECKVIDGEVSIYYTDIKESQLAKLRNGRKETSIKDLLPAKVDFQTDFNLSEIKMNTFSGDFKYNVENINIAPVKLTDIPDILNQKGTNIKLKNPQIYLTIDNPLSADYGIKALAGLKLTSNHETEHKTFEPSREIEIDQPTETFLLSPSNKGEAEDYDEWIPFEELTDIVSGNGLPKTINIDVVNPRAPEQYVENFRLNEQMDPVTGSYQLIVPLELANGSQIMYADSIKDWNDEELDCLTIQKLVLDMTANSNIALDMQLTVYPLVIEGGKPVKKTTGITTTSARIPASAKGSKVTTSIEGTIQHLDGIVIEAKALGVQDSKVLAPHSYVKLNELKACVTGYYDKEL